MTFLNPWAILILLPLFFIFKDKLLTKENFLLNTKLYNKQSKMLILALIFSIIALSRPALQNKLTKQKFNANEYIIALDASFSMQANDIKPSRYELSKKNVVSLLNLDKKNRFSIFIFTTNPLLICPPTTDTKIAINALNALNIKHILTKGTSLESLIKFVAKLPQEKKNLIIFTDGGDEHKLNALLSMAKKSAITVNIVAVASKKGIALKKDAKHLHDSNGALIISRINPILQDLAKKTNGIFLKLLSSNQDISQELYDTLIKNSLKTQSIKTDILSYKELYYYPLLLSFIFLIFALTKLEKFMPFLSLIMLVSFSTKSEAFILDFYYLNEANNAYKSKNYNEASLYFKKVLPSIESYLNIASSYYKAKKYSKAMQYYSQIQSSNKKVKQTIFYIMGNCAVKLKKYDRAKTYYKKSLALGFDNDAYENLLLLYSLGIKQKIDVADMLPKPNSKKKQNISKKTDTQKNKGGSSKQKSLLSSSGAGSKTKIKADSSSKKSKNRYQMGYKAYELINKGYTNETNPW
jgi:Ca-activated chloride channel family protein